MKDGVEVGGLAAGGFVGLLEEDESAPGEVFVGGIGEERGEVGEKSWWGGDLNIEP